MLAKLGHWLSSKGRKCSMRNARLPSSGGMYRMRCLVLGCAVAELLQLLSSLRSLPRDMCNVTGNVSGLRCLVCAVWSGVGVWS